MDILGLISQVATGGALGGITALADRWLTHKVTREQMAEKNKYEREMAEFRLKEIEAESKAGVERERMALERAQKEQEGRLAEGAQQIEGRIGEIDAQTFSNINAELIKPMFQSSYYEKLPWWVQWPIGMLFAFADFWSKIIRPAITTAFAISFVGFIGYVARAYPKEFGEAIKAQIPILVGSFVYISVTVILAWYGYREERKRMTGK